MYTAFNRRQYDFVYNSMLLVTHVEAQAVEIQKKGGTIYMHSISKYFIKHIFKKFKNRI